MLVKDCMSTDVELAAPQMTVREVAERMREGDFGAMPVCEGDRLIGMITDRDIVTRSVAAGMDPARASVGAVMTRKVLYCYEGQDTLEVARSMGDQQVRRMLVLNAEKRLVGILSLGDLATAWRASSHAQEALEEISRPEPQGPLLGVA